MFLISVTTATTNVSKTRSFRPLTLMVSMLSMKSEKKNNNVTPFIRSGAIIGDGDRNELSFTIARATSCEVRFGLFLAQITHPYRIKNAHYTQFWIWTNSQVLWTFNCLYSQIPWTCASLSKSKRKFACNACFLFCEDSAIFAKNSPNHTSHGVARAIVKLNSLRSPSPIMTPDKTEFATVRIYGNLGQFSPQCSKNLVLIMEKASKTPRGVADREGCKKDIYKKELTFPLVFISSTL